MSDERIRLHFEKQGKGCANLGSPFTAMLCTVLARILDRSTATGRRVLDWGETTRPDAVALRLCGGLHALVLSGAGEALARAYPPDAASEAELEKLLPGVIARHDATLCRFLDRPPQTNEIGRAAMLLPGFLAIARDFGLSLAVAEIGSSAGLNLNFDRFHYSYGDGAWGDPASPVRLAPELRGALPPLNSKLAIASREGCDISPIRLDEPAERLRLRSYIWADQPARLQRFDAAIRLWEAAPPPLRQADAAVFLEEKLASRRDGEAFVLFHSIMWQYMPEPTRDGVEQMLAAAGTNASRECPLAWLRLEPASLSDPFASLVLTLWPGGEMRLLARCDYHGRWIEWLGEHDS